MLVTLREREPKAEPTSPTASCTPPTSARDRRTPSGRPSSWTARTGEPAVPNGSMGFKYGEEGAGKWNLELGDADPVDAARGSRRARRGGPAPLRRRGHRRGRRRDAPGRTGQENRRHLVTTVYDLMLAQYGVRRDALPGEWRRAMTTPSRIRLRGREITGVDAGRAGGARVRATRGRGALHDHHGRRHEPLVPLG